MLHHPHFPGYEYPATIALVDLQEGQRIVSQRVDCECGETRYATANAYARRRRRFQAAGIGQARYSKQSAVSELSMACEAVNRAIDDAVIKASELDGLVTFLPDSADEMEVAKGIGPVDLLFFCQINDGAGAAVVLIHQAAMAIATGSLKKMWWSGAP